MMPPATKQVESQSTIGVLHARYEASFDEYNIVDNAQGRLGRHDDTDLSLRCAYDRAMRASERETDALRQAILYQVPTSWVDAMILQYHIRIAQDLLVNACDKPSEADKDALDVATDTIFDFMACEITADHEQIGRQFKQATMIVWDRRRFRTGVLEA